MNPSPTTEGWSQAGTRAVHREGKRGPATGDSGPERQSLEAQAQDLGRLMKSVLNREAGWHPELLLLAERLDAVCDEMHEHFERRDAPGRESPASATLDETLCEVLLELRELVPEDGSPLRHFGLHRRLLRRIAAFDRGLAELLAQEQRRSRDRPRH